MWVFWLVYILIFASFPIFYIIGIIAFIRYLARNKTKSPVPPKDSQNIQTLQTIISDLQQRLTESNKSILKPIIQDYNAKLQSTSEEYSSTVITESNALPEKPPPTTVLSKDVTSAGTNWQSLGSINLLLYLGAFLIISAATIFVAFQWETIAGIIKALLLTTMAFAFFIFGYWFYKSPKIKQAGITFLAIGSILLPVCGTGWYSFYLKSLGVNYGLVWLITSIISLSVYFFLAQLLKQKFYAYILALSVVSSFMSLVNIFSLDTTYYVLAGIFSSLCLLGANIYLGKTWQKDQLTFSTPLEVTAHIVLPVVVVYGLSVASQQQMLYSSSVTIGIFLSAIFYGLTYYAMGYEWALPTSLLFILSGVYIFCQWLNLPLNMTVYIITLLSATELYLAYMLNHIRRITANHLTVFISLTQFTIFFTAGIFNNFSINDILLLSLCGMILGIVSAYLYKNIKYLYISNLYLAVFFFELCQNLLHFAQTPLVSIFYILIALVWYEMSVIYKHKTKLLQSLLAFSAIFFMLSLLTSSSFPGYEALFLFVTAAVCYSASWYFGNPKVIYVSNFLLSVAVGELLSFLQTASWIYPLSYAGLYILLYLLSTLVITRNQAVYYRSALIGIVLTPLYFSWSGNLNLLGYNSYTSQLQLACLITAYIATFLYTIQAASQKSIRIGYAASVIGISTYFWQINYLNLANIQWYILPLGIYFFIIAYTRRLRGDESSRKFFDILGMVTLFFPTLGQSFTDINGIIYAALLLIEGLFIFFIGISLQYKALIYGSIAAIVIAVISQTYQYIFALPWWVIVGALGFLLLGIAIYLLNKRPKV